MPIRNYCLMIGRGEFFSDRINSEKRSKGQAILERLAIRAVIERKDEKRRLI